MVPCHSIVNGLEHVVIIDLWVCFALGQQLEQTNPALGSCYHQTRPRRMEAEKKINLQECLFLDFSKD